MQFDVYEPGDSTYSFQHRVEALTAQAAIVESASRTNSSTINWVAVPAGDPEPVMHASSSPTIERHDVYQGDAYLGTFEAASEAQAVAACATARQLDPGALHVYKSAMFGSAAPAAPARASSPERERMTLALMTTGRAFLTRAYIDAQLDDEVQALYNHHCAPPEPVTRPVDIAQAMKTRASMKRIHQPALEPAGAVHMRQRRSTARSYRAFLWDSNLGRSVHLGTFSTLEEKQQAEEAARQRRAMGLPVRMD